MQQMTAASAKGLNEDAQLSIVPKVSNDDDTDISPEPSPNVPPKPIEQQDNFAQNSLPCALPWSPRNGRQSCQDDGGASELPDKAAPCSPPPSSLLSEDEWPAVRPQQTSQWIRPPIEINMQFRNSNSHDHLQSSRSSHFTDSRNLSSDLFNTIQYQTDNNELSASNIPQMSHDSYVTNRSHILPTVMFLKKSLEEAHQSQFLLRQENKSLALECDRFQEEIIKWQEFANASSHESNLKENSLSTSIYHLSTQNQDLLKENELLKETLRLNEASFKSRLTEIVDEVETLRKTLLETIQQKEELVKSLSEEKDTNKKLLNELGSVKADGCIKDKRNNELCMQVDKLEKDVKETRSRLKTQLNDHVKILKERQDEFEAKFASIKKEKSSSDIEILRLQAMLHESKRTSKQLVEQTSKTEKLELEVKGLEKLLAENIEEKTRLEEKLTLTEASCVDKSNKLVKQEDEVAQLKIKAEESFVCNTRLESSIESLKKHEAALSLDLQASKRESGSMREEANRLQGELVQSLEKLTELQAENEKLQCSVQQLTDDLMRANLRADDTDQELDKISNCLKKTQEKCNHFEIELDNLRNTNEALAIRESTLIYEKMHCHGKPIDVSTPLSRSDNLTAKDTSAIPLQTLTLRRQDVGCQTTIEELVTLDDSVFGSVDKNPLADKFVRVRDSAERAAMIQEYRQEITRVRREYENEIKFLTTTHDHNLKEILHQAKLELKSKIQENSQRVQSEVQKKMTVFKIKHAEELQQLKQENHETTLKLEQAFNDAVTEISAYIKQLDEQKSTREQLERNVRELNRQLVIERQKNKLVDDFKISRKKWETETQHLIASIQEECNSLFLTKMLELPKESSPRSVFIFEEGPIENYQSRTIENPEPQGPIAVTGSGRSLSQRSPEPESTTQHSEYEFQLQSPVCVNKTLDETEAFVQSLLGEDFQS